MTKLSGLFEVFKSSIEVTHKKSHIICKNKNFKSYRFIKDLYTAIYGRCTLSNLMILKKTCKEHNCINPEHWELRFKNLVDPNDIDLINLKEIACQIDYDRLKFIGTKAYLKEYNEKQDSDFLKINLSTLNLAAFYLERVKNDREKVHDE